MKTPRLSPLLLLPLLLLAAACKPRQVETPTPPESKYAMSFDAEIKAVAKAWKDDPWGCNKVRTADKAEVLVFRFMENKPSEQQAIELLGPPDETTDREGARLLIYYFDGSCEGGKLKAGTVYCQMILNIGLDVNLLDTGGVICG
jgi:hypothetical protein